MCGTMIVSEIAKKDVLGVHMPLWDIDVSSVYLLGETKGDINDIYHTFKFKTGSKSQ